MATAADVASGLLFYREGEVMSPVQYALVVSGCAVCLVGIAIGLLGGGTCTAGRGDTAYS